MPGSPHASSHISGHHPATVRRAGRKRGARFESSEALAVKPAVARSAVELHRCCARVSCAAALVDQNILTTWPGRVAQAPRAGRARTPWSRTPCWRPCRLENRTVGGSARARRRSELDNRRRRCHRQPPSGWHLRLRRLFANFQRQRGPADSPIYRFWADGPL